MLARKGGQIVEIPVWRQKLCSHTVVFFQIPVSWSWSCPVCRSASSMLKTMKCQRAKNERKAAGAIEEQHNMLTQGSFSMHLRQSQQLLLWLLDLCTSYIISTTGQQRYEFCRAWSQLPRFCTGDRYCFIPFLVNNYVACFWMQKRASASHISDCKILALLKPVLRLQLWGLDLLDIFLSSVWSLLWPNHAEGSRLGGADSRPDPPLSVSDCRAYFVSLKFLRSLLFVRTSIDSDHYGKCKVSNILMHPLWCCNASHDSWIVSEEAWDQLHYVRWCISIVIEIRMSPSAVSQTH